MKRAFRQIAVLAALLLVLVGLARLAFFQGGIDPAGGIQGNL